MECCGVNIHKKCEHSDGRNNKLAGHELGNQTHSGHKYLRGTELGMVVRNYRGDL